MGAAHALRTGVVAAVRLVFPTSELTIELFAAIQLLGERIVARGLARMAEAGPEPTTRALLRAAILGALPSDDETSTDALLFLTFYIGDDRYLTRECRCPGRHHGRPSAS